MRRFSKSGSAMHAKRLLHRFRSNERGATAVEFALIAMPFFGLLFAIIQTSLVMFANQALQTVTSNAARKIMTGEIASGGLAAFRTALCGGASFMFDCDKMMIQVQSFPGGFASANPSTFVNGDCFRLDPPPPTSCYSPGGPRDVVLVRVSYQWPFGVSLENFKQKATLVAISAFRSEPY